MGTTVSPSIYHQRGHDERPAGNTAGTGGSGGRVCERESEKVQVTEVYRWS